MKTLVALFTVIFALPTWGATLGDLNKSSIDLEDMVVAFKQAANLVEDPANNPVYRLYANFDFKGSFGEKAISLFRGDYYGLSGVGLIDSMFGGFQLDSSTKRIEVRETDYSTILKIHFGVIDYKKQGVSRGQYAIDLCFVKPKDGEFAGTTLVYSSKGFGNEFCTDYLDYSILPVTEVSIVNNQLQIEATNEVFAGVVNSKLVISLNETLDMELFYSVDEGFKAENQKLTYDEAGKVLVGKYTGGENRFSIR
jgi:hypothetical protein